MATVSEVDLINKIALYENQIDGITKSFAAADNATNITESLLPAIIHYSPGFKSEVVAHHNQWKNFLEVQSAVLIVPRQSKATRLALLEAQTIPFGLRFRQKFQTAAVVKDLLSLGFTAFDSFEGRYGVGNGSANSILTWGGTDYFGWVFTYTFIERN